MKLKRYPIYALGLFATIIVIALSVSAVALAASGYGGGPYGLCTYNNCTPSTPATLPVSGLQVSINLINGQVIPEQGYNIIVTPLNGHGTSFKRVDFYINGILVHSQSPAEDGTLQWFWNPGQFPGTNIKIVITGQDGQTVTEEFNVTIAKSAPAGASSNSSPSKPSSPSLIQQIAAAPGKVVRGLEHAIRKLPSLVKHGLPYFLFIILACDGLLLLLQIRREIRESRILQGLLNQERQSRQLKQTFIDLVSHYLRTPLTVISGAVGLLESTESVRSPSVSSLRMDIQELNGKVDSIITETASISNAAVVSKTSQSVETKQVWQRPLFFVPIIFVGIVAFSFDYLAQHAGSFSVNQVSLVVQIVLFGSLAVAMYLTVRRLELHKRDVTETKRVLREETAFNQSRDQLIEKAAQGLTNALGNLDSHVVKLAPSQASVLVGKGQRQLHEVVDKFVVASQLKGSTNTATPTLTRLSSVCAGAIRSLQGKARAKGVSIDIPNDFSFKVQSPELLALVTQTILDNAVEYSPQQGHVNVAAAQAGDRLTLTVTDNGPGIPEEKGFALFQAFSKVEGAEVFNHAGMGFSLYLDKLIMSYLLGDITVEAAAPQGTKVMLTLPILQA